MYDKLKGFEQIIFDTLSVILVLFYSYSAVIEPAATQYHRGIYVIITYVLVFLLYQSISPIMRILDYVLISLSIITIGYWMLNFEAINYRVGAETRVDMLIATIGVIISVELARRVVGNVFVFIGILMLFYGVYGAYMPDLVSHAGDSFPQLCTSIFYKSDGIFGIMANVLATYVVLFVLFGAFLEKCGAQKFFIDWPLAAVGHKTGGPAKVSVIASGLFGSISGSAIANTVSTGAFTIPMMKKAGFKPHVAGGIEPAASIGGMFMPPIMGAGGFIMAELTGLPYSKIMLIALFPAAMYFFSVFVMVHYEAKIYNLTGEKHKYSAREILKREWFYTIPLLVITVLMLTGYSPGYSAIAGLISCVVISWFRKETRIGLKGFIDASRTGTMNSLKIGATVGIIGIIIGILTFSGLVLTFADIMIEMAGGSLVLTILLIALASLVLGMGVPVTAAYLITAVVAVPALTHLGVNLIAAHMIVYWLSQDSNITPPVCIAAFAGATIAKANMWRTAFTSFKFAKFLYLGPFLFGYVPGFSLNGSYLDILKVMVLIVIVTYLFSYMFSGATFYKLKGIFADTYMPDLGMLGAVAGGITGFLIRPAALSGEKLPFNAVLSHGSNTALLDNILNPLARDSFNIMAVCTVIGLIIGIYTGYFIKSNNLTEEMKK
jgi:TRAP transporter 4TM/12TM fusion protein